MNETLQFLVMVDGECSREEITDRLVEEFPEAIRLKENSCDLRENWIEVWYNEDYDRISAQDDEDGYLYFRYRVEVTPLGERVKEVDQIDLAKAIVAAIRKKGLTAVICANFENRL